MSRVLLVCSLFCRLPQYRLVTGFIRLTLFNRADTFEFIKCANRIQLRTCCYTITVYFGVVMCYDVLSKTLK
jgi:hypothetical protein